MSEIKTKPDQTSLEKYVGRPTDVEEKPDLETAAEKFIEINAEMWEGVETSDYER